MQRFTRTVLLYKFKFQKAKAEGRQIVGGTVFKDGRMHEASLHRSPNFVHVDS